MTHDDIIRALAGAAPWRIRAHERHRDELVHVGLATADGDGCEVGVHIFETHSLRLPRLHPHRPRPADPLSHEHVVPAGEAQHEGAEAEGHDLRVGEAKREGHVGMSTRRGSSC